MKFDEFDARVCSVVLRIVVPSNVAIGIAEAINHRDPGTGKKLLHQCVMVERHDIHLRNVWSGDEL